MVAVETCSGVLVHPRVVVYAAHCGTSIRDVAFGTSAKEPVRRIPVSFCRKFADAALGDGSDVAACVLEEPADGIEPARVLAGCEVDALQPGTSVTMVGFGAEGPSGRFGTQRVGVSRIASVGDELLLDAGTVDTCHGDSGGPLFIDYQEPDGKRAPRVVGITSSGSEAGCGTGISHYVNLTRKLRWLEEATDSDVTPCFSGSQWKPTSECTKIADRIFAAPQPEADEAREAASAGAGGASSADAGTASDAGWGPTGSPPPVPPSKLLCMQASEPEPLSTCGDAFHEKRDEIAPELRVVSPRRTSISAQLRKTQPYLELELRAEAEDHGAGLRSVTFTLYDEDGEREFQRVDEIPPYQIPVFRVPPGEHVLSIEALDWAANSSKQDVALHVAKRSSAEAIASCTGSPATAPSGCSVSLVGLALALLCGSRVKRRRGPAPDHQARHGAGFQT